MVLSQGEKRWQQRQAAFLCHKWGEWTRSRGWVKGCLKSPKGVGELGSWGGEHG